MFYRHGASPAVPDPELGLTLRRQPAEDLGQGELQHPLGELRAVCEELSSRPGHRDHPLPIGNGGQDLFAPPPRLLGHPAAGTRRTERPRLAGEGDQPMVVVDQAVQPGEAQLRVAAVEVPVQLPPHEERKRPVLRVERPTQVRHAARHHAVE